MTARAGWLSANEAADRLGVKPATLYAYVSRGVLARRRAPEGHSLFDPDEVERLARRGRPRRPTGASDVVITSRITALGDGRPYYRGRDVLELAACHEFEQVAEWLWSGEPAALAAPPPEPWHAAPQAVAAGRAAQSGLPAEALPLERLQVVTPALAATDPLRLQFEPAAVAAVGRGLIAGMVDCLPGDTVPGTITQRLWAKLTAAPPHPELLDTLRSVLVLIADHELAASTLAVRVAASVRADPYAAVTAGLGVLGGARHGGASLGAETMLAEATQAGEAPTVLGQRLRRGERIPGLGHSVYKSGDRRATYLLDRVRAAAPGHRTVAALDDILTETGRRHLPAANIDLTLAAFTQVAQMTKGAGEAIYAVARSAGWLAHAMEEYDQPTPLRLRVSYVGPDAAPR